MRRNPVKTLLLLLFLAVIIVVYSFFSGIGGNIASRFFQTTESEIGTTTPPIAVPPVVATGTTTIYAPQAISNSPGSTQIQGEGNTVVTKPDPEPITQYSLKTPSVLQNDGLYHAQIEVRIAYPKFGHLEVGPKLLCKEINRSTGLVSRLGVDAFYGIGLLINFECRSGEPILENAGYFFYRND